MFIKIITDGSVKILQVYRREANQQRTARVLNDKFEPTDLLFEIHGQLGKFVDTVTSKVTEINPSLIAGV